MPVLATETVAVSAPTEPGLNVMLKLLTAPGDTVDGMPDTRKLPAPAPFVTHDEISSR